MTIIALSLALTVPAIATDFASTKALAAQGNIDA